MTPERSANDLRLRTRRTLRVLLGIMATLAVATLLAGIRW
jgi:hypothetical protein